MIIRTEFQLQLVNILKRTMTDDYESYAHLARDLEQIYVAAQTEHAMGSLEQAVDGKKALDGTIDGSQTL